MSCRDPNAGYARYVCPGCQYEHCVPFSCKTRFCPSCGKVRVDNWVNDIVRDPLECPYCGCIVQLAEIWEPKRGHIWMKRWTVVITWHSSLKSLFWNKIWTG